MTDDPVDPIILSAAKAFRDAAGERLLAEATHGASMRQVSAVWLDTGHGEDAVIADMIAEMPAGPFALAPLSYLEGAEYCRLHDVDAVRMRLIREYDKLYDCKTSRLDVIFAEAAP